METETGAGAPGKKQALSHRLLRIAAWLGGATLLLDLIGVPASDWIGDLFNKVAQAPVRAILAGVLLEIGSPCVGPH